MPAFDPPLPFVSRGGLKLAHALAAFNFSPRNLTCADFGCSTGGFTDCLLQHGAARVFAIDTAYGQLAWKLRNDPRVTVMERTNCLHADVPSPGTGGLPARSPAPRTGGLPAPRSSPSSSPTPRTDGLPARRPAPSALIPASPSQHEASGVAHSLPHPLPPSPPLPTVDLIVADAGWTPQRLLAPAFLRWLAPTGHAITLIKPHYELKDTNPAALPRGGILDESTSLAIFERTLAAFPALGLRVLNSTQSPILGGQHKGKGSGNIEYLALLTPAVTG